MPMLEETRPVADSVPKVNDEFAVGSDLEFQKRWERFERIIWIVLLILLALSFAGAFGRGPLAQARKQTSDGSMDVKYERVQRFSTPSVLSIEFAPSAIQNGTIQLWASDNLVKPLGTQRVVPQPLTSKLEHGGILYTFPVTKTPASVEFQTEPAALGLSELILQVPGKAEFKAKIFVMP